MQLLRKVSMVKSKDEDRFNNIEDDIDELKDAIDFLYKIMAPDLPSIDDANGDDGYVGPTAQIPADIYNKIVEYSENKNFIFMGVA